MHSEEVLTAEDIQPLVLLNLVIQRPINILGVIPQQRLVFAIKHVVSQLQKHTLPLGVTTEVFKALSILFPEIKEIYGSHWTEILDILKGVLSQQEMPFDHGISITYASLKLCSTLRSLATQDTNDDLQESWLENQKSLVETLMSLLKALSCNLPTTIHCPYYD